MRVVRLYKSRHYLIYHEAAVSGVGSQVLVHALRLCPGPLPTDDRDAHQRQNHRIFSGCILCPLHQGHPSLPPQRPRPSISIPRNQPEEPSRYSPTYSVWRLLIKRSLLHAVGQACLFVSAYYNSISITSTFYNLGPVITFFLESYMYRVIIVAFRNPSAGATWP